MFRNALQDKTEKLIAMMTGGTTSTNQLVQLGIQQAPQVSPADRAEIHFWAIKYTYILTKKCPGWILNQPQLVETIRRIWCNEQAYQEKHRKGEGLDYTHWKEPKLIIKILLEYFKHQRKCSSKAIKSNARTKPTVKSFRLALAIRRQFSRQGRVPALHPHTSTADFSEEMPIGPDN